MLKTLDTPSIYVACLAAYNNGKLHGQWIDATQDIECIHEKVQEVLHSSPEPDAEEFAIHDYDSFGNLRLSEYEGLERVHDLAVFIEENSRFGCLLLEHFQGNLQEAERALEEYAGEYASLADYAMQLTEETSEVPRHLENYIDYEAMGRDMELNGDIFMIEVGYETVHVFWNS